MSRRVKWQTEREVQKEVVRLYRKFGCVVYTLSDYRTGYKRVTRGVPDLYVVHARAGDWFHETKAHGGKQSPAQKKFQTTVEQAGAAYVLGGMAEAQSVLIHRHVIVQKIAPCV